MNVLAGPRLARSNSARNPPSSVTPLRPARISIETALLLLLLRLPRNLRPSVRRRKPPLGDLLINHSPVIAIDERLCRASLGALSAHGGIRQISRRLYRRIIDRTLLDRSASDGDGAINRALAYTRRTSRKIAPRCSRELNFIGVRPASTMKRKRAAGNS